MFRNRHSARVSQMFEDQFEPDGVDFLYRKSMRGAPIRVTAAERAGFIADFGRRQRYLTWGAVLGTVILIVSLVLLIPDLDPDDADPMIVGLGMSLLIIPFLMIFYRIWNAPARALERRPSAGAERTRAEAGKVMLGRMSYGYLFSIGILGAGALVLNASRRSDVLHGWGRLWLVFAGAMVIATLVQIFRKWRNERAESA